MRNIRRENNYVRRNHDTGENFTLAEVAVALDMADAESIERRANSGMGAGAYLEAVFDDDETGDVYTVGEEISSLDDSILNGLEAIGPGDVKTLRKFIHHARTHTVWNGNNHVTLPRKYSSVILAKKRSERPGPGEE